jgi:hypothetical protein
MTLVLSPSPALRLFVSRLLFGLLLDPPLLAAGRIGMGTPSPSTTQVSSPASPAASLNVWLNRRLSTSCVISSTVSIEAASLRSLSVLAGRSEAEDEVKPPPMLLGPRAARK